MYNSKAENFLKKTNVIKELEKQGYKEHHTAYTRDYMSRKANPRIEKYEGKFGKGLKVHTPAYNTNNYHYITYMIEE